MTSFPAPYKFLEQSLNFVTSTPSLPCSTNLYYRHRGNRVVAPAQRHAGKSYYRGRTFDGAFVRGSRGRTLGWNRRLCEVLTAIITVFRETAVEFKKKIVKWISEFFPCNEYFFAERGLFVDSGFYFCLSVANFLWSVLQKARKLLDQDILMNR